MHKTGKKEVRRGKVGADSPLQNRRVNWDHPGSRTKQKQNFCDVALRSGERGLKRRQEIGVLYPQIV